MSACSRVLALSMAMAPHAALAGGLGAVTAEPVVAPVAIAPVAVVPSDCCFDGAYIGGQIATGDSEFPNLVLQQGDGQLLSLHAGYGRALGKVVLGGELDVSFGSVLIEVPGGDDLDIDQLTRARVRLGYDLGRVMPYLAAGVAGVNMVDGPIELSGTGSVYTLGAEYCLSERITLGVEASSQVFPDFKTIGPRTSDLELTTVGLRASWHF